MIQELQCELLSWATVRHLSYKLAVKIRDSHFKPDVVVAIARGGFVPARLLCDFLNLTDLRSIRIVHYASGAQKQQNAKLVDTLCHDLDGRNVLLVDDVSDTGDTLELACDHLEEYGAGSMRIAVLQHKHTATVEPHFYAHRIVRWRWIIYPWAVTEDVTGFIDRLPHRPFDADEARVLLRKYYGLRIRPSLMEEIQRIRG